MKLWNTPNTICFIRTALIPLAIIALYFGDQELKLVGTSLILLSFVLDAVDGWVARKFHEETTLGSLIDVIADRITEYMLWVFFTGIQLIPLWAPLIVIPRGVITDAIRSIAMSKGISVYSLPKSKIARFLVSNRIPRLLIGGGKLVLFVSLGLVMAGVIDYHKYYNWVYGLVVLVVLINLLRGLPVIFEAKTVVNNDAR